MSENKSVKLLFYCTKAKPYILGNYIKSDEKFHQEFLNGFDGVFVHHKEVLNDKIVAEAKCVKVENVNRYLIGDFYRTNSLTEEKLYKKTCLNYGKLLNYVGDETGYAIHLKNVKPFEEPIKLAYSTMDNNSLFYTKRKRRGVTYIGALIRAPQNMMYCYDKEGNMYVLISISPKETCQILNGEQTILVRKSILNALKELIR